MYNMPESFVWTKLFWGLSTKKTPCLEDKLLTHWGSTLTAALLRLFWEGVFWENGILPEIQAYLRGGDRVKIAAVLGSKIVVVLDRNLGRFGERKNGVKLGPKNNRFLG